MKVDWEGLKASEAIAKGTNSACDWFEFQLECSNAFPTILAERASMRTALEGLLGRYVDLVNCGDCGFWDPEKESVVINAREALKEK